MTQAETLMLACCCGVAIGTTLGNLIGIIWTLIDLIREKHRQKNADKAQKAE